MKKKGLPHQWKKRLLLRGWYIKTEEKIAVMKEKDNHTVKWPNLYPKKLEIWNFCDALQQRFACGGQIQLFEEPALRKHQWNYFLSWTYRGKLLPCYWSTERKIWEKQVMVNAHHAKLIDLPVATFKLAWLRSFYITTEKHLRCLCFLGKHDNQMQVVSMIQSKLPRSVLVKLEEMKPEEEEWTVKNF